MAKYSWELVEALRRTATRLETGGGYRWSHFGQCNCGNLVQTVTSLSPEEIQQVAYVGAGDWGVQAREYCITSGYPLDYVFGQLFDMGMRPVDVQHLERLSDPQVLRVMGVASLSHHRRDHVVRYMRAWAALLEEQETARVQGSKNQDVLEDLPLAAE